jgi:hypothetical protein
MTQPRRRWPRCGSPWAKSPRGSRRKPIRKTPLRYHSAVGVDCEGGTRFGVVREPDTHRHGLHHRVQLGAAPLDQPLEAALRLLQVRGETRILKMQLGRPAE